MSEQKILKQVEFYFSNSNLPKDKFLRSIVANHPEGYVPIETLASFKRMQSITTDIKVVIKALKASKLLQVDKTEKLVRRTTPLPEVNDIDERTVFVSGLDVKLDLEGIKKLLEKYGQINCIRMRKDRETKNFDGNASIEFEKKEDMKKFIENSKTEKIHVITNEEREKKRNERKLKEKKKSDEQTKEKMAEEIKASKEKLEFESGSILNITNIGNTEEIKRNNLREAFEKYGEIGFIDYPYGLIEDETRSVIRFKKADTVKKIMEDFGKDAKKFLFGDKEKPVTLAKLNEKEEEEYFEVVVKSAHARRLSSRKRGYRGNNNRGGNKKRRK